MSEREIRERREARGMRDPLTRYDRHGHREQGYEDALAGRPRALGGTAVGYREGYDRGLTEALEVRSRAVDARGRG